MALINGLYVFVENESVQRSIESTSHPTETGLPITSTIQKQPIELSLSGCIVNTGKYDANTTKTKLQSLQFSGSLITYQGRNAINNLQIQSFDCDYDNKIWGGLRFTMKLKQVRIAKSSYTAQKKATTSKNSTTTAQKKAAATTPNLVVGATVVFKGGAVYVSSDASKAAANRGRSTCKILYTNLKSKNSWSKHEYCLKSTDGGKVYGWVDKANIEGVASTSTATKTNSGTQQVSKGKTTAVYHTVKKGNTVYALVTKNYKSLGKSVSWVINNNPKAFSKKGDPKTLKIGAKLLMGYK